jgi:uncharacterized ion transporter superfamily protein YfcC
MNRKIPDVFVIVFALIVLSAALTWILPGGSFERRVEEIDGHRRELVVPGSYRPAESAPQLLQVFTAPLHGFVKLAEIIVFILLVGGAFFVLNETGAIAAGTARLARSLAGREFLVIPIVMTLFSFFGAAFGMCEEAMPFALIFVPLAISLGYDSIVGVCLTFLAAGVGFAGAFLNPFTLQIAQGIAGVKPVSGWEYRLVVWGISTALVIAWVMIYAARIRKDPRRSPMYELDRERREELEAGQQAHAAFTWRHGLALGALGTTIVAMIVGVVVLDWYIAELGGLFVAMGIVAGAASGMGPSRLARVFVGGARDMAGAALIVGFAGGILVILEDGGVMDTILHGAASATAALPPVLAADAMYGLQVVLNFFIPSGSTKAALTMPLMAPLADLSGITRQTAVLAYQLGDGFTNMIIPTSGVTIGTLAMARIPYQKWLRWNLPMQAVFVILSLALLVWPVLAGWE